VNNTIRASEAFFTYVTSAKRLMKIYVPFDTSTSGSKGQLPTPRGVSRRR
jgi:hypothetical protein